MVANYSHVQSTVGLVPHRTPAIPDAPTPSHTITHNSMISSPNTQNVPGTAYSISSSPLLPPLSPIPVQNAQTWRDVTHVVPTICKVPYKEHHPSVLSQMYARLAVALGLSSGGRFQDQRNRLPEELGAGTPTQGAEETAPDVQSGDNTSTEGL